MPPADPLPVTAVRDLLGIARALYRAARSEGRGDGVLQLLSKAGKKLRLALELAQQAPPGSMGHRAAWRHAEEAIELISRYVEMTDTLQPVVNAAIEATVGRRLV